MTTYAKTGFAPPPPELVDEVLKLEEAKARILGRLAAGEVVKIPLPAVTGWVRVRDGTGRTRGVFAAPRKGSYWIVDTDNGYEESIFGTVGAAVDRVVELAGWRAILEVLK